MADDLSTIDVSRLDQLAKIKADQQSLRDLAAKAADYRDKVTEVYTRVLHDYETRIQGLEQQADALRQDARQDFERLESLYAAARTALEQARFELQESEFRREIGEYSVEEFARRQKAVEATIGERQQELERITLLRKRFVETLPVDPPPTVAPQPVAPPSAPPHVAAPPGPVIPLPTPARIVTPAPAPPPGAAAPPPAPPASSTASGTSAGIGETMVVPPPATAAFQALGPSGSEGVTRVLDAVPPLDGAEPFATVAVPAGLLVQERAGASPVTHRLGVLTTIGRTPDNQIVVPSREVSRKHAEIILGDKGYLLKDLGSPNGTFVNGQKVKEHVLQDGDRITVAGQFFVFKPR